MRAGLSYLGCTILKKDFDAMMNNLKRSWAEKMKEKRKQPRFTHIRKRPPLLPLGHATSVLKVAAADELVLDLRRRSDLRQQESFQ